MYLRKYSENCKGNFAIFLRPSVSRAWSAGWFDSVAECGCPPHDLHAPIGSSHDFAMCRIKWYCLERTKRRNYDNKPKALLAGAKHQATYSCSKREPSTAKLIKSCPLHSPKAIAEVIRANWSTTKHGMGAVHTQENRCIRNGSGFFGSIVRPQFWEGPIVNR